MLGCLAVAQAAAAAPGATLFRLFLLDGSVLVSYGEYVRFEEDVIFSMPVGGSPDVPRLQVVTLRSSLVDWPRTDRYAASARYQRYADTRGEEDYQILSNQVATALNTIALSSDRQQAIALAERARQTVAAWPQNHYGYRHDDIREIVSVLDQALSSLRAAAGLNPFELSFVAMAGPPDLEPLLGMPTVSEQLDQLLRVASIVTQPADRVALLQASLALIGEAGISVAASDLSFYRRTVEQRIRRELDADREYAELSTRLVAKATDAAQNADGPAVQRLITQLTRDDAKLGHARPQLVEAINTSLQTRLDDARRLRLLRDQWLLRRSTYRQYQRSVGYAMMQLSKSAPSLEAIRALNGPDPERLVALRTQLSGGAERLERMRIPGYLSDLHHRLIGAWRFAENAAKGRFDAIASADTATAWEASSSAAGALMMLGRVQRDLEALLTPPRLQ